MLSRFLVTPVAAPAAVSTSTFAQLVDAYFDAYYADNPSAAPG